MTHVYPVHERFYTWQGEGRFMGTPAFFIRLFGCPVKCPWCDSAGTWHPNYVPKAHEIVKLTAEQLKEEIDQTKCEIVVVTGGEPTIHNLQPLTELFTGPKILSGPEINLETSGAFEIKGQFHWVTLSPKRWALPRVENVREADEFKLIIEKPEDIEYYTKELVDRGLEHDLNRPIWLHPEWSQHDNPVVLEAINKTVKEGNYCYRAGWQLHKFYRVDAADARSRPLVPLGGNPLRGY